MTDLNYIPELPDITQHVWMAEGICAKSDNPDLWFPNRTDYAQASLAKKKCNTQCAVRSQCLTYALEQEDQEGIWGGYDQAQRRRLALGLPPDGPERTHCARGHEWTEENVYDSRGRRECRRCAAERRAVVTSCGGCGAKLSKGALYKHSTLCPARSAA